MVSVALDLNFDGDELFVFVPQNDVNAIPRTIEGEFNLI
jgi:hypothetical protein